MSLITTTNAAFTMTADENLLEALERTGHEVEYQCRSGYCGSCRTKIVSGKVSYADTPLAFVAPNEILPCCCMVTENIEIVCTQQKVDLSRQAELFPESSKNSHTKRANDQENKVNNKANKKTTKNTEENTNKPTSSQPINSKPINNKKAG